LKYLFQPAPSPRQALWRRFSPPGKGTLPPPAFVIGRQQGVDDQRGGEMNRFVVDGLAGDTGALGHPLQVVPGNGGQADIGQGTPQDAHDPRSESLGTCGKVFQTVGVAIPPTIREVA
jgi:hypothetical protein